MPEGQPGSWEDLLHAAGGDSLLIMRDQELYEAITRRRGQRAIGVVYEPRYEVFGNYVPTVLLVRYDAFLFINETQALHPLHLQPAGGQTPETYPWGL